MSVPDRCPVCGSSKWIFVDKQRKGFSVGKAAIGGFLLGPVGLLGGALGASRLTLYNLIHLTRSTYSLSNPAVSMLYN